MKYLKLFESLDNIHEICKIYKIYNYTINSDGSIDVDDNVNLTYRNLTKLPLKFRNVSDSFNCHNNNLTSLEGSPNNVSGNFYCSNNKITSLEGSPTYVGGNFYCKVNPVYEIWKLFLDKSKIELFNDYDIIRGKDIVINRLNDFLITIGKKPVKSVEGYNNI